MALPNNVVHINLSGYLPRGEQFTTGFWVDTPGPMGQAEFNGFVSDITGVLDTDDVGAPWRLLTTNAGFTTATGYLYGAGGNPGDRADLIAEIPYTHPGTAGGGGMPLQVSMVLSMRGSIPGASRRGRMYLPAIGASLASGQLTQGDLDNIVNWWHDRFVAINALADPVGQVVIVSKTLGITTPLTAISADSRLDIQRRRANKEAELFQSSQAVLP